MPFQSPKGSTRYEKRVERNHPCIWGNTPHLDTPRHTILHYIKLCYDTLHYTRSWYAILHYIILYYTTVYYTAQHYIIQYWLHYTTLHHTTCHGTVLGFQNRNSYYNLGFLPPSQARKKGEGGWGGLGYGTFRPDKYFWYLWVRFEGCSCLLFKKNNFLFSFPFDFFTLTSSHLADQDMTTFPLQLRNSHFVIHDKK